MHTPQRSLSPSGGVQVHIEKHRNACKGRDHFLALSYVKYTCIPTVDI